MSVYELIAILGLTSYAIYQQTRCHEVVARTRFKLTFIYLAVGLLIGGMHLPSTPLAAVFPVISILLSLIVGQIRGRLTRLWVEDGKVYSQGTPLTVAIFLGLIASKFVLGTIAYFTHASDTGGIGEILIMLAIMMAIQAELIHRRAMRLEDEPVVGDASLA
ncbi:hypothetical protein [Acidipropionibacterium jensenii]|uniref:hypothetical protein n=1 Tax=Acidipropionibacterium jensenii TaxID=1749 RepID=UPI0026478626|nr:hypothetical protein [Acidipropionibacterium jensenii]MDN5978521.1 hypothetical protein [Acidipropionibacterium jensenii]MDN6428021.1 hypothetical protein [Acidipropionibacterium jensenii]MDN6441230.1 hypothetical protein [Acidipropionibacterium jensenii]MDN6480895.1 hypothetical protein [Acidipropionibacterium jensenii]MDN6591827.1 hypothetical protein [Acidipropionibacterium jensenii]